MSRLLSLRNAGSKLRPGGHASSPNSVTIKMNSTLLHSKTSATTMNRQAQIQSQTVRRFKSNSSLNHPQQRERNLTAAQLQLHLSKVTDASGSGQVQSNTSTLSELTAWVLHKVKVPKGEFLWLGFWDCLYFETPCISILIVGTETTFFFSFL